VEFGRRNDESARNYNYSFSDVSDDDDYDGWEFEMRDEFMRTIYFRLPIHILTFKQILILRCSRSLRHRHAILVVKSLS
jgi:hypothetical protein